MNDCLAIPTDAPGGLDAPVSPHFGHCGGFALLRLENGEVQGIDALPQAEHDSCMEPVLRLIESGATALAVAGIGRRPLLGCGEVGLRVFSCAGIETVGEVAAAWAAGKLPEFTPDGACGGGHAH
ncbi:NifB/NifX family molybdenum-iron cluster-binding protein [Oleispirillum naphthae]|uniref:NifB/NifX family molybdenum-iron cluster-binding protein n=1 Tax=Oleispirillum naphthae TaxID=2838853 RepID=UPI0030825651